MSESLFSIFNISSQGMALQRKKLQIVSENIANANTTKAENGLPYQRQAVVVRGRKHSAFEQQLTDEIGMLQGEKQHIGNKQLDPLREGDSVVQSQVVRDNTPPRLVYDPGHPDADENGYVAMPNVNVVTEMVEMMTAQRGFEANTAVINAAKNMARDSLEI